MRITPLDIRKQEFRKAMRGLDADEVYAFLSTVGDEYESILNDNKALRERLLELDDKVQEYRKMEKTLRDTLLTAERVTLESKENARREAGLIIKEAQFEAEKALRDINTDAMNLRQEVSQLRGQRESYLGRMKVIAESLLKFIENVETDFHQEDETFGVNEPQHTKAPASTERADGMENGDLFRTGPAPSTGAPPVQPGVPQDLQTRLKTGSPEPPLTQPDHLADGPPETDKTGPGAPVPGQAAVEKPVTEEPPVETREQRPQDSAAPESGSANDDGSPGQALSDINDIIERMSEEQKSLAVPTPRPADKPAEQPPGGPKFQAIPPAPQSPPSPPAGGSRGEVEKKPAPTAARPWDSPAGQPVPAPKSVEKAMDLETEVATVLEQPPTNLPENNAGPVAGSQPAAPSDPGVTSELSLEEIQRGLEERIAKGKEQNRDEG
jgi:cell division initiation protein